jgi:hypothetical protein
MIIDYVDGELVVDGEMRPVFGNPEWPAITVTQNALDSGVKLFITRHYMIGVPPDLWGRIKATWRAAREAWAMGASPDAGTDQ